MKVLMVLTALGVLLLTCGNLVAFRSPPWSSLEQAQASSKATHSLPGIEFKVTPATMRACDPPSVATVSWNAAKAGPGKVKIFVVNEKGGETLFAFSEKEGSLNTGSWVRAKSVFLLKNADETQQLGKFVVGSTKCK